MPTEPQIEASGEPSNELVIDACALLNLEAMGILSRAPERFSLLTAQTVVWELEGTARYDDYSGDLARRVLERVDHLTVSRLGTPIAVRHQGEQDCRDLARQRGVPVIIDDLEAAAALDAEGMENYFSVFVLFVLTLEGTVTLAEARSALDEVRLHRSWRDNILYQTGVRLLASLQSETTLQGGQQ